MTKFKLSDQYKEIATICLAILLIIIRFLPLTHQSFPLNDGGMFISMTQDLVDNDFRLPAFTSYNHDQIPFAYPPLAFYLASLISQVGLPLLVIYTYLPALLACLLIPAFYLLSREILKNQLAAIFATIAFSLLPRSYLWFIMGGGMTRSLGWLFAILALWQGHKLFTSTNRSSRLLTPILLGLAILSHPEKSFVAGFSLLLLMWFLQPTWKGLRHLAVTYGGAIFLSCPWWLTVINYHGLQVFIDGFMSGFWTAGGLLVLFSFNFTEEPFLALVEVLTLLGIIVCLIKRQWLLPAWIVTVFFLNPRSAPTTATIPIGLLAGVGMHEVVWPRLQQLSQDLPTFSKTLTKFKRLIPILAVTSIFGLSYWGNLWQVTSGSWPLKTLPETERQAMQWVAQNTPSTSQFIIITARDKQQWSSDIVAEWFPVFAQRTSQTLIQGYEWKDDAEFYQRLRRYFALKDCDYDQITACLDDIFTAKNINFNYVYVSKAAPARHFGWHLMRAAEYQLVYDGAKAMVFEKL